MAISLNTLNKLTKFNNMLSNINKELAFLRVRFTKREPQLLVTRRVNDNLL